MEIFKDITPGYESPLFNFEYKTIFVGKPLRIFKVHITPLTKFRPENPCGVKRSHTKKFPESDLAFPYN